MTIKFDHFLKKFPIIELPVTLRDDSHHDFSKENDPLPAQMIQEYITHYETTKQDEDITEYVPCFQLPVEKKTYKAIVYWKAGLLSYDYVLAIYDSKLGIMIDKKAIAGTKVVGKAVKRILAFFKEDFSIQIAEGIEEVGKEYIADSTKTHRFEILDNGRIEQDY